MNMNQIFDWDVKINIYKKLQSNNFEGDRIKVTKLQVLIYDMKIEE